MRSTVRTLTCIAALALSSVSVVGTASAAPTSSTGDCSLAHSTVTATAAVDQERTDLFADYGNSGVAWTGGDSTYSVPLKGGKLAWIFSDTFLGPVNSDLSRPETVPFLNQSVVIEKNGELSTITGGTEEAPDSLVKPTADGAWHWFGAATKTRTGDVQIGVLQFAKFGPGAWDWGWKQSYLATFDGGDFELLSLDPLPSSAGVQWASWIERKGPDAYVYGVEDRGAEKFMHVAKVLGGDLTNLTTWRYWNGTSWVADESASARVMPGVANEYSVTPFKDGYLLVTQDTSVLFSGEIRGYVSCSPQGPFTSIGALYQMPEVGLFGSYGNPNIIVYNAHEHPELRRGNTLEVTYNVNSFVGQDLYDDVTIYRPRFVKITLDVDRKPVS